MLSRRSLAIASMYPPKQPSAKSFSPRVPQPPGNPLAGSLPCQHACLERPSAMTADPALLALHAIDRPLHLAQSAGRLLLAPAGSLFVPAVRPQDLGDTSFRADHRLRYAYLTGAMAN